PAPAGGASRSRFRGYLRRGVFLSLGRHGRAGRLESDSELVGPGQFGQISEAQRLQEERGRSIEQRPAHRFAPPYHLDEPTFLQGSQHTASRHPPNVLDLRTADRLAIRDHRERLQGGAGQLGNSYRELSLFDRRSEGPPGENLVAPGQLDDLHRMAVEIVVLA